MPHAPVSKSEFKTRALEYLQLVETSGKNLIVTEHGRPVLEIRPYHPRDSRSLHILRGTVVHYDDPLDPAAEDDWGSPR
nr:type II toxin-antitoxin system Phd/YefM family antitoxin [Burkholderia stabilis]